MINVELGRILFRIRSFTPIPFYIVIILLSTLNQITLVAALILTALGESLRVWALGYIGEDSRVTKSAGAQVIVISGPYMWTRNPLYIGNILIYLGFSLLSNEFWVIVLVGTSFFCIYCFIVQYEEFILEKRFGYSYAVYQKNSSRFFSIPNRPTRAQASAHWNFKRMIQSEHQTWVHLSLAWGLIFIKFYLE